MRDRIQSLENTPPVRDRRACPRLRITALICIDIGNLNGGMVTSLSENGLALTWAANLETAELGDGPLRMRIQFPGIPEAIEANGQIVCMSSSGKEACVRFEELAEQAREQIRRWISDRVSRDELWAPPKLPKMQLPTSRQAKTRGPRFSFADVASSPVDAEGETNVEDLPEITGEPGELLSLQVGAATFPDRSEAVASAFESPAFTEGRRQKAHSGKNEREKKGTPNDQQQRQPSLSIPERRQHPRKEILLFTYAVLGEDNGGLVFNLSEGGLALTAAATLQEHHFSKLRARFPDSADWFETSGRLAWKSDSGKEAGIEFLNLPQDARARIGEWVSQADLSGDFAQSEDEARSSKTQAQELPSFMELEESFGEPFEIPASLQEQPFENQVFAELCLEERTEAPASSPALFKTGVKGIFERASVRRRVVKIKPPRIANHSPNPRGRVARRALSIAAGAALAAGGWMFFQRSSLNEVSNIILRNPDNIRHSYEPRRGPDTGKPDVGASETADPAVQPREPATGKTGSSMALLRQIKKPLTPNTPTTAMTNSNSGFRRSPMERPGTKDAHEHVPVKSSSRRSSGPAQGPAAPTQREQKNKSPQRPASVPTSLSENKLVGDGPAESKPIESKPAQIAQGFPAQDRDLNAPSPSPSANPSQPASAPPVALEKETSAVAAKQPEPVLARTPLVTVSFDPFPSILMPKAGKPKKSHQGKSLQMGRLVSRVDPVYPGEAKQQGIEGTVKVHAIFNREGAVQSVISVSGPPLLLPAAINAVRQWRYSQTILGGQAMETEEDVTVLFRLANSAAKN